MSTPSPPALAQARRALIAGEPLPAGLLSPTVQRSWERARAAGIRPQDQALFQHYVSQHDMRRVQESHHELIALAQPDLEHLWRTLRAPDWVVLLTDPDGTIVHSLGTHPHAPRELRLPLQAGRRLQECELGTNAPGVVASEGIAVEVHGDEHFLTELRRFRCAAAPILGLDGQVIGVLDITGFDVPWDSRMLERVQVACYSIESRLFEQTTDGFLLRLHEDQRFLGTPAQGLLWVREDGQILAANRIARDMLELAPQRLGHTTLPTLDTLFDGSATAFTAHTRHPDESRPAQGQPVHTRQGVRFFLQVEARTMRGATRPMAWSRPTPPSSHTDDPTWQQALLRANRVFPSGLPILLHGETGTGKEWFSRALHQAHRPGKPFIAVNCAALAENLAESELFGHVEGAFTGSRRGGAAGRLEQAHHGTLFLDEIGDMPLPLQTRLLRVLQERCLTRVGSGAEIPLDILVVAASHRDLRTLVAQGSFREDLYFRLNGLTIRLPALRERQDIDTLIDTMLSQLEARLRRPLSLTLALRERLRAQSWPGNLRQLQHVLHVTALLADADGLLHPALLPDDLLPDEWLPSAMAPDAEPRHATPAVPTSSPTHWPRRPDPQPQRWQEALAIHGGNVSATARSLGISRTTLYKHLRTQPKPAI